MIERAWFSPQWEAQPVPANPGPHTVAWCGQTFEAVMLVPSEGCSGL